MPSDTPTPAEIAAKVLHDMPESAFSMTCAHAVIAALSEHYHLLPKVEEGEGGTFDAGCGATAKIRVDGHVSLTFADGWSSLRSPRMVRQLASALASAADVAEEPK